MLHRKLFLSSKSTPALAGQVLHIHSLLVACSLLVAAVACNNGGVESSSPSVGGAAGTGGGATGGASAVSTGGNATTGGVSSKASTGGAAAGGKTNSGGSTNATGGGTSATGGKAPTGGNATTGGVASTGGASGSCADATPMSSFSSSTCVAGDGNCFSFFVASRARMFALAEAFNGSTLGWGGDLTYGTGDGLAGADKICTEIAEQAVPGNCRTWKGFLSTSTVDAISRVGTGPWYDRLNRVIANNLTELAATRPGGITNSTILNNLPNEDGTPHHNEEANCTNLDSCADNHDVMTGSDGDGKRCTTSTCSGIDMGGGIGGGIGGGSITDFTCQNWTLGTSMVGIAPRCGHTWPTGGSGGPGGGMLNDWISVLVEGGCAAGYTLLQNNVPPSSDGTGTVGSGGGYGGIYCLASE
jgi:hypothetical protein